MTLPRLAIFRMSRGRVATISLLAVLGVVPLACSGPGPREDSAAPRTFEGGGPHAIHVIAKNADGSGVQADFRSGTEVTFAGLNGGGAGAPRIPRTWCPAPAQRPTMEGYCKRLGRPARPTPARAHPAGPTMPQAPPAAGAEPRTASHSTSRCFESRSPQTRGVRVPG